MKNRIRLTTMIFAFALCMLLNSKVMAANPGLVEENGVLHYYDEGGKPSFISCFFGYIICMASGKSCFVSECEITRSYVFSLN